MVALVSFAVYEVVISPISEMGKTPFRPFRTADPPPARMRDGMKDVTWKLLLVWDSHPDASSHISNAATATARWENATLSVQGIPCMTENSTLRGHSYEVAVLSCPEPTRDPVPWTESFPNFDLSVNFTGLMGTAEPGSTHSRDFDAVRIYVGLTEDINSLFQSTDPVSLFPGTDLLSVVRPVFRERLQPASLATLGFERQDTFMIAVIEQTITNPFTSAPTTQGISTLGLTLQTIINEWTIMQDYRSRSVLTGLSSIGGLSSLLSAILVMLLGTSLMTAILRTKPHSSFGFLHNVASSRRAIVTECDKRYPWLREDLSAMEHHRGVVSYIFDTLLALDMIGYQYGSFIYGPQREAVARAEHEDMA
ncbi:hypothetical protein FA13DRAFT_1794061 [Coprinellus micaceus]|uniref:Uncharacterized protein n=1 Tax=Coprinellus micaceus TaxID=71717 RepID=A0A4Y7T2F8_COPMI|nr:hypothetical protein FA13DRAFT_1794061 [Coprinellus micaceus]